MIYLLIDANIFLGFLFARDESVLEESMGGLIKCLDQDKAKLIMPECTIKEVVDKIYDQYSISLEKIKSIKNELNDWQAPHQFERKKEEVFLSLESLIEDIQKREKELTKLDWIKALEKHPNTLKIEIGDDLLLKLLYQMTMGIFPFNKKNYAWRDAVIAEIASNPSQYFEEYCKTNDEVWLITFDRDFIMEKNKLEKELVERAKRNGIKLSLKKYLAKTLNEDFGIGVKKKTLNAEVKIMVKGIKWEKVSKKDQEI